MEQELQKILDSYTQIQNNKPIDDFEGYSATEMDYILYDTFGEKSPIKLLKMKESDYNSIPILNIIKYTCTLIENEGEIKLTQTGALPRRIVLDIYAKGFFKEDYIEKGYVKLLKEADSLIIHLCKNLILVSKLVKVRNNKISMTESGKKIIMNNHELLKLIFLTFGQRFNMGYYDLYGDSNIGNIGFGYSIFLVSRFGVVKRPGSYYSKKYFKAFPYLLSSLVPNDYHSVESQADSCYSLRTFSRFLDYFGLINIHYQGKWDLEVSLIKTELFDKLIKCSIHKS
ncbi:MAG: hypothetical protein RO257_05060 [Candidatus Kapabacteria bacterium]|nr:hypothetical protein [Candidatus Kapabacteria bacterium]